jgi:hypothetical protein
LFDNLPLRYGDLNACTFVCSDVLNVEPQPSKDAIAVWGNMYSRAGLVTELRRFKYRDYMASLAQCETSCLSYLVSLLYITWVYLYASSVGGAYKSTDASPDNQHPQRLYLVIGLRPIYVR